MAVISAETKAQIDILVNERVTTGGFIFSVAGSHGWVRNYKVKVINGKVAYCNRSSAFSRFLGCLTFTHSGKSAEVLKGYIQQRLSMAVIAPHQCATGKIQIGQACNHQRAGRSDQLNACHIDSSGNVIDCIAKTIQNNNEAVMYVRALLDSESHHPSLYNFMPELLAVLDENGNDLLPKLKSLETVRNMSQFLGCRSIKIIMRDVRKQYANESSRGPIIDLKFASKSLRYNKEEKILHGYSKASRVTLKVKDMAFNLSSVPFVYSNNSQKSLSRLSNFRNTQRIIERELNQLTVDQLISFKNELEELKSVLLNQSIVGVDSSLLLIPTKNEQGEAILHVKFVDLAHGVHESESLNNFQEMRSEMEQSVLSLIHMVEKKIRCES
ncbi:hypothetical protein JQC92_06975 [Shewanella sp. 202IG2-18]|uniref:hypothetical protein n=1 Tax=Parashewanella hymeniacidonis TaxID=2807618 RepID=UPI0019600580|nr:hypothetical protein [Parashewanella hymeniacidonis]MBM7071786.1 hypothetical protein [Parashewanella hymeniacidonis]